MVDAVEQFCRRHGLPYRRQDDLVGADVQGVIVVFQGYDTDATLHALVQIVRGHQAVTSYSSISSAERDTAVYLTAVNYSVLWGGFCRDRHDGEITFEQSIVVHGSQLTDGQIAHVLDVAHYTAQKYGPRIQALLSGRVSLAQALVELDRDSGASAAVA
jgi:hypothetical protein